MTKAQWTGTINFGLVSAPVKLYGATESHDISFNNLHGTGECHGRLRISNYCEKCASPVTSDEVVKGFQYEKDHYVIMNPEDFETAKTERSDSILIDRFVDMSEVDPIFFEKAYYLGPDKGGDKPFVLLAKALFDLQKIAVGMMALRNREHVMVVRPVREGSRYGLVVNFLLYKDEVRQNESLLSVEITDKEMELAKLLISSLSAPMDLASYQDGYVTKIEKIVEAKVAGKPVDKTMLRKSGSTTVDLLDALQKSVDAAQDKKSKRQLKVVTK